MISAVVNGLAIAVGSALGLLLHKGIPNRISQAIMTAMGLCVVYIGISGSLQGQNTVVLIISMAIGTGIGTLLDIDGAVNRLGDNIQKKFQRPGASEYSLAEGFVSGSLLFCIGAMAIVGSVNSGLKGDHEIIFTKSIIDGIAACMMASALGPGVMLSGLSVFIYQGTIVLLSGLLQSVLTEPVIAEMSCAGSIMIMAVGTNMTSLTKFKVADMLPTIVLIPFLCKLSEYLPV